MLFHFLPLSLEFIRGTDSDTPSIHPLILAPLSAITEDDALSLGVRVYSIIAKAHEVMEKEQCTMAAVPPGLSLPPSLAHNPSQHAHCKDVWAHF